MKSGWQLLVVFSTLLSLTSANLQAQTANLLPLPITAKIDSLFTEFTKPNTPGCAIGVVRNDSLIFAKGYGLANLEKQEPISPQTPVYLASVSKQFTAYAIVLLAKAGKLKLSDDIRVHLPWFPDLKRKITIRHLLNHTSGIRDDLELVTFGGLPIQMGVTQDVAIQYIKRSRSLNFDPGQRYLYSNSNYVLLAEIVKEKSGQPFKAFTETTFFRPLAMKTSRFIDSPSELPKERALSYVKNGNAYFPAFHAIYTMGDGGMFSTIEDLSRWVINFYNPTVGDQKTIAQLTEKGILNNNEKISYALGIGVDDYKGFRKFEHGGALYGYRTNIAVFPDLKMGIILLSNNGTVNTGAKTNQLTDILLKQYPLQNTPDKVAMVPAKDTIALNPVMAKAISGKYIAEDGLPFTFTLTDQDLNWESNSFGRQRLVQTAKMTFEAPSVQVKFVMTATAKDTTLHQFYPGSNERLMTKYIPNTAFLPKEADAYTGSYYSPELETTVEILFKDEQLQVKAPKLGAVKLTVLDRKNMVITEGGDRLYVNFLIDNEKVTGFDFNTSRLRHLRFEKVK
jgi:CubicO group peptidase (beta-lactamase class C family)